MYWELYAYDESQVKKFAEQHNLSTEVVKLLISRGIDTSKKIKDFLNSKLEALYDPFDFEKMGEVVERIILAKEKEERVFIYGDYDVDGITASAYLTITLRQIGLETIPYISNRIDEGYGLNRQVIDYVNNRNGKVIITVDTGINSFGEFEYAKSLGIDIIITDHHRGIKNNKEELLIINPKLSKNYKFKELSGVGVAFKVACGVYDRLGEDRKGLYDYLDIVMIGTIADVMPLVDENRIIVKNGLDSLKKTKVRGLKYLFNYLKLSTNKINTTDISFFISPLLNALGRIGESQRGVDFFLAKDEEELFAIIEEMKDSNNRRRILEREIFEDIDKEIRKIVELDSLKYLFLQSENWHPGVIGVVASRLAIKYNIPVILVALANDIGKASCRSVPGVNIFNLLNEASDNLIRFGGHDLAAGFVAKKTNFEIIEKKISSGVRECKKKNKNNILKVDYKYPLEMVDEDFMRELSVVAPYGSGNTHPLFTDKNLTLTRIKKFGVDRKHFKAFIEKNGKTYSAVGFNLAHKIKYSEVEYSDKIFEIAYYPEKICYNNNQIIQIKIRDLCEQ